MLTVWTVLLADIPASGEHRSVGFSIYIYALVLQFGSLSTIAAYRLWAAGRDQPSVARNRMRLLSLAALALTAALFFAALIPSDEYGLQIAVNALAIASALIFLLGLAPPEVVRAVWRRPEQERTRHAIGGLMATMDPEEVVESVLPAMRSLVGAKAVYCSRLRKCPRECRRRAARPGGGPHVLRLEMPGARWSSSPVPMRLSSVPTRSSSSVRSALTGLALDRSRLFVQEREQRIALERADEMKTNFIALAAHEPARP